MRYECGASLDDLGTEGSAAVAEVGGYVQEDGHGEDQEEPVTLDTHVLGVESIFNTFFMDESLSCSSPVEKHLYEIIPLIHVITVVKLIWPAQVLVAMQSIPCVITAKIPRSLAQF